MHEGKILSVFVDESGRFQYPDKDSRFCLGRRVTSYTTRDAKEIAKLLAMLPFCKVFAWCPTAAEIIV